MSTTSISFRRSLAFAVPLLLALLLLVACGKKETTPSATTEQAKQQASPAPAISSPDQPPAPSGSVNFGPMFARRTGDLDEMQKKRNIRALVILSPIGFFYDKGQPRGANYEAIVRNENSVRPVTDVISPGEP